MLCTPLIIVSLVDTPSCASCAVKGTWSCTIANKVFFSSCCRIPLQCPIYLSAWVAAWSVRLFLGQIERYHYLSMLGEDPPEDQSLTTTTGPAKKEMMADEEDCSMDIEVKMEGQEEEQEQEEPKKEKENELEDEEQEKELEESLDLEDAVGMYFFLYNNNYYIIILHSSL